MKFYHFRFSWGCNTSPMGGVTLCVHPMDKDTVNVGLAYCSVDDYFYEATGDKYALTRLVKEPHTYPRGISPQCIVAAELLCKCGSAFKWELHMRRVASEKSAEFRLTVSMPRFRSRPQCFFEISKYGALMDVGLAEKARALLDQGAVRFF